MIKRALLSFIFSLSTITIGYSANVDYKNFDECQTAMDEYIQKAEVLGFPQGMTYVNWFNAFQTNPDSSSTDCTIAKPVYLPV